MKFPPKVKRIALYATISVLAYLGPVIYATEASAPYADMKANGFPRFVMTKEKEGTTLWKGAFQISGNLNAWEPVTSKYDQTEEDKKMVEAYITAGLQKGPLNHGGAIRNMALSAFAQTLCHLAGTMAGMLSVGEGESEHWAAAQIAGFLNVAEIYRKSVAVHFAEYAGKWAGWWLFLLLLSLPYKFYRWIRDMEIHEDFRPQSLPAPYSATTKKENSP